MGVVKLIQFIHPNATKKNITIEIPEDVYEMANGQFLTCEMMPNDMTKVVFYSRKIEWDSDEEDCEIAVNFPGDNTPKKALERLILQNMLYVEFEKMIKAKNISCDHKNSTWHEKLICDDCGHVIQYV